MGIESDQLVFDYLSRVGDLAQQRGLPSAARMRLVATLRAEIDAQKADSVPGVRRILSRLGTPEAVVAAAGAGGGPAVGTPRAPQDAEGASAGPAVPLRPDSSDSSGAPESSPGTGSSRPAGRPWSTPRQKLSGLGWRSGLSGLTGKLPAPREGSGSAPSSGFGFLKKPGRPERPPLPDLGQSASPPHLASAAELGDTAGGPDWWRVEASPFGPGETVPGFVGGIEIPEIWERPPGEDPQDPPSLKKAGTDAGAEPDAEAPAGGAGALPGMLRKALRRWRGAAADDEPEAETADGTAAPEVVARAPLSPVLSLAVLLLAAGALLGSWLALAGGWGLAYVSRRLSRTEAKFAALGVPGIVVAGLMVWLWGRFDGRWGDPIAQGRLGQELADGLPAVARVAAVASALFLVWRMRRAPG
ncbi:hypothetical protein QOM21_15145 [Streptomyces sp. Pv4-95]|uniref:hypothetical protein n=1 Tax=Streptomyces sp. Pv4-95 TaxID=3049543 RepID=UPI0038912E16